MKIERSIIIIHSGEMQMFAEVIEFVSTRCIERGDVAFMRNTDKGHEIYSVKEVPDTVVKSEGETEP